MHQSGTELAQLCRTDRQHEQGSFLAVAEIFADSETAQVADVLLPAALWIEKEGVTGQGERRYQYTPRLLDPPGQCRSDLAILVDLADRLGLGKLISARHTRDRVGRVASGLRALQIQLCPASLIHA